MKVFALRVLALLQLSEASAEDILLHGTSFRQPDSLIRLLQGEGSCGAEGLILRPGAAFRIRMAAGIPPRNGAVRFAFKTFRDKQSPFFMFAEEQPAFSLTAVMGRWATILNEDSLHVGVLDSTYSRIDAILESAPVTMDAHGRREVEIRWRDRRIRISVGGRVAVETSRVPKHWGNIDFWVGKVPLRFENFELVKDRRDSIKTRKGSVDILATFRPGKFKKGSRLDHHALVWSGGRSQPAGLFVTAAPDSAIYQSLLDAGGKPGKNLTRKTWNGRFDQESKAPDRKSTGDAVTAEILFAGKSIAFEDLIQDGNGRPIQLRFSGNGDTEKIWNSGCVICLHSCPAAKVGNASYSVRDWVHEKAFFRLADLPTLRDGDEVILRLHLSPRLTRSRHPLSTKANRRDSLSSRRGQFK